uniref:Uncharacterized protein n=1 Tax=Arundo donax TaxID=35708 RepID=A0A0A9CBW7_ARUDO
MHVPFLQLTQTLFQFAVFI